MLINYTKTLQIMCYQIYFHDLIFFIICKIRPGFHRGPITNTPLFLLPIKSMFCSWMLAANKTHCILEICLVEQLEEDKPQMFTRFPLESEWSALPFEVNKFCLFPCLHTPSRLVCARTNKCSLHQIYI